MPKALVTGFTGQDGAYLSKLLLSKGYEVYGMMRRNSHPNLDFIYEMGLHGVKLVEGDLSDDKSIDRLVKTIQPDEIYNLAAQSHVGVSFQQSRMTLDVTGYGPVRFLEAIREYAPNCRMYQAGSSEQFGDQPPPQSEDTIFSPRSPYACAKVYAHNMCKLYRDAYGIFVCAAILFNHESSRRGEDFVTRKITAWLGRNYDDYINDFQFKPLRLGYLDSFRDWGSASRYVEAMWLMLQQEKPDDYVIGTGYMHSVREFCEAAFEKAFDTQLKWEGEGYSEKAICTKTGKVLIEVDPSLYRKAEVPALKANPIKAMTNLGWEIGDCFNELVCEMVEADMRRFSNDYSSNKTDLSKTS